MYSFTYDKYNYFTDGENKVVAVATYAGKPVRGVAKCDPQDNFDLATGKELAAARCNAKIAKKRQANAFNQMSAAKAHLANAEKHYNDMLSYYKDACEALDSATISVADIESRL
jgi:hypothetical protein